MTKQEFKARWESDGDVGGLTWTDIEDCAIAWGLYKNLRFITSYEVRYAVLSAADTVDAESFHPDEL